MPRVSFHSWERVGVEVSETSNLIAMASNHDEDEVGVFWEFPNEIYKWEMEMGLRVTDPSVKATPLLE